MRNILVFGGTKNTGLEIVKNAISKNNTIFVMARKESDLSPLKDMNVTIIEGDAFSLIDCKNAVYRASPDVVISTLGGKNAEGKRIDAIGNINVINAIEDLPSLRHFILVTSMGSGEQYETASENVKKFLGEALRAKTEAENLLRTKTFPWTILRPGGLTHDTATGKYQLSISRPLEKAGYISRQDIAEITVNLIENSEYYHTAISAFS